METAGYSLLHISWSSPCTRSIWPRPTSRREGKSAGISGRCGTTRHERGAEGPEPVLALVSPSLVQQAAQDHLQHATVPVVLHLDTAVDADRGRKVERAAVLPRHAHRHRLTRLEIVAQACDVVRLGAVQVQRVTGLAVLELQRKDTHGHQIAAMDPLVALGDDRLDAEQHRALGRPVAGTAGAVLFAGNDEKRRALLPVALGGIEDAHHLAAGLERRPVPFLAGRHLIAQPDVAEGAADHHLVVAAARAVAVKVPPLDT